MRAYFNMPTSEFVGQLRDIAIRANARTAVIDCIDAIYYAPTEDEIEAEKEALAEAKYAEGEAAERKEWVESLEAAQDALMDLDLSDSQYQAVRQLLHGIDPIS